MIEDACASIINACGEDVPRRSLIGTTTGASKAFQFLTRGDQQSVEEIVNGAMFPSDCEMVAVDDGNYIPVATDDRWRSGA